MQQDNIDLIKRLCAEFIGSVILLVIIIGSGIQGENNTQDDAVRLILSAVATGSGLFGLLTVFGPISGAHFNPCISLVSYLSNSLSLLDLCMYTGVQVIGSSCGTILADFLFRFETQVSKVDRGFYHLWLSEFVSTATLVFLVFGCIRMIRDDVIPLIVSLWVSSGWLFGSSNMFVNPAATIGRIWTGSLNGIDPISAILFVIFQILGSVLGWVMVELFYYEKE
jgi:glycerol uptake facilitator-like aquaporin